MSNDVRYGVWAGNPRGVPEDPKRCVKNVYRRSMMTGHQCARKRGHGVGGLYCQQHAKQHPAALPAPAEGRSDA